jgi:hypothetical protein
MLEKDFQTEEEARAYLAHHEQEFNTLEHKLCPLINGQCNGSRCACWEPAAVYKGCNWHVREAYCLSPTIHS